MTVTEGGRQVTYREPEWDEDQLAMMLEWQRREHDRGPHGHPLSESTSPLANPSSWDSQWTYVADLPVTDYAEKARQDAIDRIKKQYPDGNLNGLIFPVRRVEREEWLGG